MSSSCSSVTPRDETTDWLSVSSDDAAEWLELTSERADGDLQEVSLSSAIGLELLPSSRISLPCFAALRRYFARAFWNHT
jgi:hypothetical protein